MSILASGDTANAAREAGVRLAEKAGVKQFVIFHHAPEHTDDDMDAIADEARVAFANSIVAREGMILRP